MANNYQVIDAYGSVISIQSSIFGSDHRQIVGASILGTVPVSFSGAPSISGSLGPSSVWVINPNQSVSGTVIVNNGSVVQFQGGLQIHSVISSNPSSMLTGSSIFGQLPAGTAVLGSIATLQGTNPWITSPASGSVAVNGSVVAFQGGSPWVFGHTSGSIAVNGSVVAFQGGAPWANTNVGSIISLNIGSIITKSQDSSIIAVPTGSVITTQIGSVITVWKDSSILSVPVGSVIVVFQAPSIVGTYVEDAASASGDRGILAFGIRNDAVASLVSADLDYGAWSQDSAGRHLTKPFAAEQARVEGYNSVVSTSVTTLVAAAGAGLKNYITDIVIANTGAATTLVTFRSGGGTSVLGYAIAPTAGGSNMLNWAMPLKTLANETFDFQATTSTSILFVTVKGFKAP